MRICRHWAHCAWKRPIKWAAPKQKSSKPRPWNSYNTYLTSSLAFCFLFSAKLCKCSARFRCLPAWPAANGADTRKKQKLKINMIRLEIFFAFYRRTAAFNLWLQFSSIKLFLQKKTFCFRLLRQFQDQDCVKSRVSFHNESDYVSQIIVFKVRGMHHRCTSQNKLSSLKAANENI